MLVRDGAGALNWGVIGPHDVLALREWGARVEWVRTERNRPMYAPVGIEPLGRGGRDEPHPSITRR